MRRLFVTGTGTGVGKTTVGAGLLTRWRRAGRRVAPLKPAETGCERGPDGALRAADAERLRRAAGLDAQIDLVCPCRYDLPAAPQAAAAKAGLPFDLDAVKRAAATFETSGTELLLVESAGGLLVPFARDLLASDVARELGCRATLVVGTAALGTINQTLLTLRAARAAGLDPLAVILVQHDAAPHAAAATDAALIEEHGGVPVLGTLPHLAPQARDDDDALAAALAAALDLTSFEARALAGA
jgi:dethiobiotin synthase